MIFTGLITVSWKKCVMIFPPSSKIGPKMYGINPKPWSGGLVHEVDVAAVVCLWDLHHAREPLVFAPAPLQHLLLHGQGTLAGGSGAQSLFQIGIQLASLGFWNVLDQFWEAMILRYFEEF